MKIIRCLNQNYESHLGVQKPNGTVERLDVDIYSSPILLPGTVILTGTPHGVGMAANPPCWPKPGDSVTIEIDNIGRLTKPVEWEDPAKP